MTVLTLHEESSDENVKSVLTEVAKNRLLFVNVASIDVARGNVVLKGKVQNLREKTRLKKEFLQIPGARGVFEGLGVKPWGNSRWRSVWFLYF